MRSQQPARNQAALNRLLCALVVRPFDQEMAKVYGAVRASLEEQGIPIGPLDTLIAAHAKRPA